MTNKPDAIKAALSVGIENRIKANISVFEKDVWNNAIEAAADIVDDCNREGPYNAIGAASRIRSLKK